MHEVGNDDFHMLAQTNSTQQTAPKTNNKMQKLDNLMKQVKNLTMTDETGVKTEDADKLAQTTI